MCLFALSKVCSSPSAPRTGQTLLLCVGLRIKRALIQTGSPANGGSAHDSRLAEASVEFVYRSNSGAGTNINILLRQPPLSPFAPWLFYLEHFNYLVDDDLVHWSCWL